MAKKDTENKKNSSTSGSKPKQNSHSFYWRATGVTAIALGIILLLLLAGFAFKVLLFVLSGILVACFFRGIAGWIHHETGVPKKWSLIVTVIGAAVIFAIVYMLLAPKVAGQVDQISQKLPSSIANAEQYLQQHWWGKKLISLIPENPQQTLANSSGWASETFGLVSSTFGIFADLYIIVLLGIFFMVNPAPYVNGIVHLVPQKNQSRAREIINEVYITLQRWLTGKLLSMLVVAVLTGIGLAILGVPLPLTLALLAGLLAFIPNFGPIFALIPAVLLGFLQGPAIALYVVILYMGVQAVESNVITPFIQREMVHLPLAMIIIAQVILGILVGGLGLILATPIVAAVIVLIRMIYIEDILNQQIAKKM